MKKIIFGILPLLVVILVSGCSSGAVFSPTKQLPISDLPDPVQKVKDHYAPVIEEFTLSKEDCYYKSSIITCRVNYYVQASDDVGIKCFTQAWETPLGGGASHACFDIPQPTFIHNGSMIFYHAGNYSLTYTFEDESGKQTSKTKSFSLP